MLREQGAMDNVSSTRAVPHVMVVDPNFDHYKPLAASARLGKLDLHFRASGVEALKVARRQPIDAWLIAAELEDMSGQDFVELLRSKLLETSAVRFQATPRVAIVNNGNPATMTTVHEAIEAGADAVVSQPITFRDLEDLLGVASLERAEPIKPPHSKQAFVTLPIGVGAAVVAIAVLMMN